VATGPNSPKPARPADAAKLSQRAHDEAKAARAARRQKEREKAATPLPRLDALSFAAAEERYRTDRARRRRKNAAFAAALALLMLVSLCLGVSQTGLFYTPAQVWGCLAAWFRLNVVGLFVPSVALEKTALMAANPMYHEVVTRMAYTVVTVVCGAMLACSGMLYQNVFRNPIAAPTMLGVQNGVSLGLVAFVWVFGTRAPYLDGWRYAFCFAGGLATLALVAAGGKVASGKRPLNLVDMLLVGTIVSQLAGTVVNYVVNYLFTSDYWLAYYELNNATDLDASAGTVLFALAVAAVSFAPVVLFRFRMNCVAFSDADMRLFGVNPTAMRFVALAAGSLMILTAQTLCGTVSMVSLVVPFAARAVFGSEFRKQLLGNVLLGALVLLVCRDLVSCIPFVGDGVPLGTMVTFVTLPAFVWVMAIAQRQWNDK
jgi:iron complex transport system permease protein